jgi:hypothetical protein
MFAFFTFPVKYFQLVDEHFHQESQILDYLETLIHSNCLLLILHHLQ